MRTSDRLLVTIIEGPICRYSDLSFQLYEGKKISWNQFLFGMQRIVYGLMKKIVIADRLNLFIKTIFHDYNSYDGGMIALGALLYTCQLYMEFSGTMDVIIGSGEMFALKIEENFRQPFFSKTISEFWQRWHISLGLWFKDYIFYPLSMSKPLKKLTAWARKKVGNHYGLCQRCHCLILRMAGKRFLAWLRLELYFLRSISFRLDLRRQSD